MKKYILALMGIALVATSTLIYSCNKEDVSSNSNSVKSPKKEIKLVAEITKGNVRERKELIDLGNVYESHWNKRVFEDEIFSYDINYTSNVLDTKFSILKCDKDEVSIETEEGDTLTFYNITSSGKEVSFDMQREDNSVVHFKFTSDQDIDFVKSIQSLDTGNNTKFIITISAAALIIGTAATVVGTTVGIVALARSERNRKCDIEKRNGERQCSTWGCGIWEGDCCVACIGGDKHPNCKHRGAVRGIGSDCNNRD